MTWTTKAGDVDLPVVVDDEVQPTVAIVAHGAGSGMDSKTLLWLSGLIRDCGASVVRFNFPYRALGKSIPDRMPVLIDAYRAVIESVKIKLSPHELIIGGHSMGGRAASMLEAEGKTADGLLLCSYPLHPPGQFEKLRDAHLPKIETKTLQLNGTLDEFCNRELMDQVQAKLDPDIWTLHWIEDADHSYGVKKASGRNKKDVEAEIRVAIANWLTRD